MSDADLAGVGGKAPRGPGGCLRCREAWQALPVVTERKGELCWLCAWSDYWEGKKREGVEIFFFGGGNTSSDSDAFCSFRA